MINYAVKQIKSKDCHDLILNVHYAHRLPSISYAFGLFENDELVGIVTYGSPASPFLCRGVCGEQNRHLVIELNRLVLVNNKMNEATYLIAQSLKLLPKPRIVVSYADTAQGHLGTVYLASNWLYTGKTKPRTDMKGMSGNHSRHHLGNRNDRVFRSAKHRFVMFIGDKRQRKALLSQLNYPVMPYAKNDLRDSQAEDSQRVRPVEH